MISINIPIEPMGAVRMTGRGKFVKPHAQRYLAYKNFLQWHIHQQLKGAKPLEGILQVSIQFVMPIPKSLSEKRKSSLVGTYHTKKPDIDNMIKGVFDALNKLAWKDDNQVSKVSAQKRYGIKPAVYIDIVELREEQ